MGQEKITDLNAGFNQPKLKASKIRPDNTKTTPSTTTKLRVSFPFLLNTFSFIIQYVSPIISCVKLAETVKETVTTIIICY